MSSDEEIQRKEDKPTVTLESALLLAKSVWGLRMDENAVKSAKELESYDDKNFMLVGVLEGRRTQKYLLKVHNGVESRNLKILEAQNKILNHIYSNGLNTTTSISIPSKSLSSSPSSASNNDIHFQELPVHAGGKKRLAVRLLKWVEGIPMVDAGCTAQSLINAGEFLAKLNQAYATFDHEGLHRYHSWDLKNTADLRKFLHCITDDSRRSLISDIIETFEREVKAEEDLFPKGCIQGDFNDANIIVKSDNIEEMAGVIDFGDAVHTYRVNDVAIALAYAMVSEFGQTDPLPAAGMMLKGYCKILKLQTIELKHLRTLMACRLAISTTLGAYSFQQNPTNEYLLIHAEPAWKAIDALWNSPRKQVETFLLKSSMDAPTEDLLRSLQTRVVFITDDPIAQMLVEKLIEENEIPIDIVLKKTNLPQLQGELEDLVTQKCLVARSKVGGPAMVAQRSISFRALNGLPGVYYESFLEKIGPDGLYKMLAAYEDKRATVHYSIGLTLNSEENDIINIFEGQMHGKIVPANNEDNDWGGVFRPDGFRETYKDLDKDIKFDISACNQALKKLKEFLITNASNN